MVVEYSAKLKSVNCFDAIKRDETLKNTAELVSANSMFFKQSAKNNSCQYFWLYRIHKMNKIVNDSERLDFLDYLRTVLPPDALKTFLRGSIVDKTVFCLGETEGVLVNNECSS